MSKKRSTAGDATLPDLLAGIASDTRQIAGDHLALFRAECAGELRKAAGAAAALGAGAGLTATAGVFTGLMAVHLLHRVSRLPLWACYGLVGGALGAAGLGGLAVGRCQAAELDIPGGQTIASLREDITWAREQAEGGA